MAPSLDDLATELILPIFRSCLSARDALALSQTSHRYHAIYTSKKLSILQDCLETECGPLEEAVQLVTHTPGVVPRPSLTNTLDPNKLIAPISIALFKQVHAVGQIAKKWEELYPYKKWKVNYAERRSLSYAERRRLRQAVYRVWLYSSEFHSPDYPRETRTQGQNLYRRTSLLRGWRSWELNDIRDVQLMMRKVVESSLCPSNNTIIRKFRKRNPECGTDLSGLLFNIHLNYPEEPVLPGIEQLQSFQTHRVRPVNGYKPFSRRSISGREAWGDQIQHYYVVQDMMKLNPEQIMFLRETAACKEDVSRYIGMLGDWFENNGETMCETVEHVLRERGLAQEVIEDSVMDGVGGILADEEDDEIWHRQDRERDDDSGDSSDEE